MWAAKVQARLRIRAVSPEPSLLAHTSSESRGTFRQKARSLAPLNGWACAVKICHDGMLEDTNSLDGAHLYMSLSMTKPAKWPICPAKTHICLGIQMSRLIWVVAGRTGHFVGVTRTSAHMCKMFFLFEGQGEVWPLLDCGNSWKSSADQVCYTRIDKAPYLVFTYLVFKYITVCICLT